VYIIHHSASANSSRAEMCSLGCVVNGPLRDPRWRNRVDSICGAGHQRNVLRLRFSVREIFSKNPDLLCGCRVEMRIVLEFLLKMLGLALVSLFRTSTFLPWSKLSCSTLPPRRYIRICACCPTITDITIRSGRSMRFSAF
jgi:hypothetical protein